MKRAGNKRRMSTKTKNRMITAVFLIIAVILTFVVLNAMHGVAQVAHVG